MISREQMEQAIADGGSVLVNGQIVTRSEDLPQPEKAEEVTEPTKELPKVKAEK